jgi:hypothetical protein
VSAIAQLLEQLETAKRRLFIKALFKTFAMRPQGTFPHEATATLHPLFATQKQHIQAPLKKITSTRSKPSSCAMEMNR